MASDPYLAQILARLGGPLDPPLFELCACDLLRTEWPTLVPISGGTDDGMDGIVALPDGSSLPLICTTAADVARNLRRSLRSIARSGRTSGPCVVATSQSLSKRQRSTLERSAQEAGFVLQQVYDREAFGLRLYSRPDWCLRLLDLTGQPSALSVIPRSRRPARAIPMVGRLVDLEWLTNQKGDCVLAGEPGSGKTFLAQAIHQTCGGLFLVSDDLSAIAQSVRQLSPARIMVDDTHDDSDRLVRLRHLRSEIGATFQIVAISWPGAASSVADALGVATKQTRRLTRLTRDEILLILRHVGVHGPLGLVREIVSQSQGLPGLAVTLAILCLEGNGKEVILGDALTKHVSLRLGPLVRLC